MAFTLIRLLYRFVFKNNLILLAKVISKFIRLLNVQMFEDSNNKHLLMKKIIII